VWKMVPTYILWKTGRGTIEDILSLFFRTLYLWTIAYVTPLSISYSVCLLLVRCFLILSMYLGVPYALMILSITYIYIYKIIYIFLTC
jgi:hypothetical protein